MNTTRSGKFHKQTTSGVVYVERNFPIHGNERQSPSSCHCPAKDVANTAARIVKVKDTPPIYLQLRSSRLQAIGEKNPVQGVRSPRSPLSPILTESLFRFGAQTLRRVEKRSRCRTKPLWLVFGSFAVALGHLPLFFSLRFFSSDPLGA